MHPSAFSGPGVDALGKTRSGREFNAYGGPSLSGVSSGSGENGDLGVEAGGFGDFGFVSPPPAQNLGSNGQWAASEPSEASESGKEPHFEGGEGEIRGSVTEKPLSQTPNFSDLARFLVEKEARERGEN